MDDDDTASNTLPDLLDRFIAAESWDEAQRIVEAHPELLSEEADTHLAAMLAEYADNPNAVTVLTEHRALLRRCREAGIARAFAEKVLKSDALAEAERLGMTPEEFLAQLRAAQQMPPALREVLAELAAAGVEIRSPDDLERALAARPNLRAKLEAAMAEDEGPPLPPEFAPDLRAAQEGEQRYRRTGDLAALDAAAAWTRILDAPGFIATEPRFRLAVLNDAGGVFLRRFWARGRGDDLDRALALWSEAVAATPAGSPDLPSILNNLGTGLRTRFGRTGRMEDLEEAIRVYQAACQLGALAAPQEVLNASRNWGRWALARQSWGEAAEAWRHGLTAGRALQRRQLRRADKESWLTEIQEMAPAAAYALARLGEPASAVQTLELGRAQLLVAALEQNRRDLTQLPALGHADLHARYQAVRRERQRLEAPDAVVAGDRFAAIEDNDADQSTPILPDADSPPIVFDLKPRVVGPTSLVFDFRQAGNPVGTAVAPIEITGYAVVDAPESCGGGTLRLSEGIDPPDLILTIQYDTTGGAPRLLMTLEEMAAHRMTTFEPTPLRSDPEHAATALYGDLTSLAEQAADHADDAAFLAELNDAVQQIGFRLWKMLIPAGLKELYQAHAATWADKTLLVVSDEPYIPWELVWPYSQATGQCDDAPWAVTLRLLRWLRRDVVSTGYDGPPAVIPLQRLACVAPDNTGLAHLVDERDFLRNLLRALTLDDVSPPAAGCRDVLALLRKGGYDWLHIVTHGVPPDAETSPGAIELEDAHLLPGDLIGPQVEGYIYRVRPGSVLNICHGGRQTWGLTQLDGWANVLIGAGAGLVAAPRWAVTDRQALAFAQSFYRHLLGNMPVAQAVHEARRAAFAAGDPTWLAYSVYAHPNATLAPAQPAALRAASTMGAFFCSSGS